MRSPCLLRGSTLNRECLLHLFSFLDKDSRKNLARTCLQLQDVFQDPALWPLLHFRSLIELKKDNFFLSPALRSLSICWYSSRVQVCSIEDWLKSAFQRSVCSRHESLVNDFLLQVCDRCPNLATVTLSGCGHVTDDCLARLLRCCPRLRALRLENCARVTNRTLAAVAAHGVALQTLHVDFCRNVSAAGLRRLRAACPRLALHAEHSAAMIPDQPPRGPSQAATALGPGDGRNTWRGVPGRSSSLAANPNSNNSQAVATSYERRFPRLQNGDP